MRSRGRGLLAAGAAGVLMLGMGALPAGAQDATEPEVETVRGYASGVTFDFAADFGDFAIDAEFGPAPEVTLPSDGGGPFTESLPLALVDLGEVDADIATDIEVSTEGALGPDGFATSSATIGGFSFGDLEALPLFDIITASLLEVECNSDIADGPTGSTTITDGSYYRPDIQLLDQVESEPEPNTVLVDWDDERNVTGGVEHLSFTIVLNEQTVTDDDITVVGIRVSFSHEFVPTQGPVETVELDAVLGEATCGFDLVEPLEPVDPPLEPVDPVEPTEPVTPAAVTATPRFTG